MPRRPGDPELVFDNDRQPTQDGLAVIDGVLLFAGETVGDVAELIDQTREDRIITNYLTIIHSNES